MNLRCNTLVLALLATLGESFVAPHVSRTASLATTLPSRTARFAATNIVPPPNDEVERLQTMAAKLREEAALLEAEQKAAITKVAQSFFRKFDTDQNGRVDVSELQAGLERLLKLDLPEQRAQQLVQAFDTNGDGVLQPEEFVGVDQFRNKLDALVRQEKDAARQQAKQEREQAQGMELLQAQLALVNDKEPSATDKVVSVLPYLFPLLDGLQFAGFLVAGHPDNPLALAATIAYALYRSIPFGGLLAFFGLSFLSDQPQANRLVRFNAQQAVLLDIALFAPAILASLGGALLNQVGVSLPANVAELGSDGLFLALLATVAYASVSSLLGKTPNALPFISKRVEDRMITPDMYDADGRFAPFDENGNLKRSQKKEKDDRNDDSKN